MHSNSLWYLGLSIMSIVLMIFVCFKSKTYRSLLMFFVMGSVAYIIDTVNYIFLKCYQFYPKFTHVSEFYDSNLGGMSSNLLILPATAVYIAVFQLSWAWNLVITGLLVGIEWLFLHLGIYRHYWWKLSYSAISLPFYFLLAKVWFPKIMHPLRGFLHFVTLYLITAAVSGNIQLIIPLLFLRTRMYHVGWFDDPYQDSSAFASIWWLSFTLLFVLTLKLRLKWRLLKYTTFIVFLYLVITFFQKTGIQHSTVWWDKWYCISVTSVNFFVFEAISKRLQNWPVKAMNSK